MRTENKMEVITREIVKYIANDGTEFYSKEACEKYETDIIEDITIKEFESIPHSTFNAEDTIPCGAYDEIGYVLCIRDKNDLDKVNAFLNHFNPWSQNYTVNESYIGKNVIISYREYGKEAIWYGSVKNYVNNFKMQFDALVKNIE